MASPQVENGFVQISNEVLDALCRTPLSNYDSRVVWCVIRKTYGWKKKEDWIALSQFIQSTGIAKPHVCRALRNLVARNIVTKRGTPKQPLYSFQKNYDKWITLPKGAPQKTHSSLPKGAPQKTHSSLPKGVIQGVPKGAHTKETITKEILSERASHDSEVLTKQTKKDMRTYDEDRHFDEPAIDADSGDLIAPKKKSSAKWPDAQKVFDLFSNPARSFWKVRPVERLAAQTLFDMYGLEKLQTRVRTIEKYKDDPECPVITSPSELLSKMDRMEKFLKRVHG